MRPRIAEYLQTDDEDLPCLIVAREPSELADRLRSQGWIARAGWRVTSRDDQRAWLVRFEHPSLSLSSNAT